MAIGSRQSALSAQQRATFPAGNSVLGTHYLALLPWLLAALLGLLPTLPLAQVSFFRSDDGLFHLYRIDALTTLVQQGYIYPRWFPTFGFGYGQPVLNFYSPLLYYVGVAFAMLGFDPAAATKLTVGFFHLAAALGMFAYAQRVWRSAWAGVAASAAYSFASYHLADLLTRGALAEHAAFAWFPLILLTTYLLFQPQPARWILPALTLSWAGLVLTHHLSALMFAPVSAVYALALTVRGRQIRPLLVFALASGIALALTAFYWLPTLQEARFVGLGDSSVTDGYRSHLAAPLALFQTVRGSGENGEPRDFGLEVLPTTLSLIALLQLRSRLSLSSDEDLAVLGLPEAGHPRAKGVDLAQQLRSHEGVRTPHLENRLELILFTLIWLLAAGLLTTTALPLWQAGELILFRLQYPWRWLSMVVLGQSLLIGALPSLAQWIAVPRWVAGLSVAALLAVLAMFSLPLHPLVVEDMNLTQRMWAEDAKNGQIGATWTGEFVPVTVKEQRWAIGRAPEVRAGSTRPVAIPDVALGTQGANINRLRITNPQPVTIRFHTFYFPGWQVRVDGQEVATGASGILGLASATVPAGTHEVAFVLRATPTQRTAIWISLGGLLALLGVSLWVLAGRWQAQVALLITVLLFGIAATLIHPLETQPRPLAANIDNQALLLGYQTHQVGRTLQVTLYWWALHDFAQDYSAFVHLVGSNGTVIAQHDGQPVGGYTPTSRWQAGELVIDEHDIALPTDLASGSYRLKAGLYQAQPLRNLPVLQPAGADTDGNRVTLGNIPVQ